MWDKIKKAINSNLAKPLDTFMTEQFNSWATQRGRLDVAISSRASQTSLDDLATGSGIWSADGRTLSHVIPSSTARLSVATERTASTLVYKFLMKSTGAVNIFLDVGIVSGGGGVVNISVRARGIEMYAFNVNNVGTTYIAQTLSSVPVVSGVVEVVLTAGAALSKAKNFKVMYDYNNVNTPTLL